jgi:hypothetical protein
MDHFKLIQDRHGRITETFGQLRMLGHETGTIVVCAVRRPARTWGPARSGDRHNHSALINNPDTFPLRTDADGWQDCGPLSA